PGEDSKRMAHAPVIDAGNVAVETADTRTQPWPKPAVAWFAAWSFAIALCFARLEGSVMQLIIITIQQDFNLNDSQIGLLGGVAPILIYALIAVPASRYVDIWPRNIMMMFGIGIATLMTTLSGLAQSFWQLFLTRVGVGLGGVVNGPATYSMM